MLRSSLGGISPVRNISFFVPANRLNEYTKRQLQNNASLEVYEENYEKLNDYYTNTFINNDHHPKIHSGKPFSKFEYKSNVDIVSKSLDSINLNFLNHIEENIIPLSEDAKTVDKFIQSIHHSLYNKNIRNLYDTLKSNVNKIHYLKDQLSPVEISVIIKRLIYYNESLTQQVKFLSKNKGSLNGSNISDEITKLNTIRRSIFLSTKSIFNGFSNKLILNLNDYEDIILFHYNRLNLVKAIQLISEFEEKVKNPGLNLYMTNTLWLIKMDILSRTNKNFWKIFSEPIKHINQNSNISSKYLYPHHGHNFQMLVKRYESDKSQYSLTDNLSIINIIIRGLGKHCDIPSLDKLLESYWGIKIDRNNFGNGIRFLEHFNIKKNVKDLIWPNEEVLISILLAYCKNGELSTAIEVNNLILDKYNNKCNLDSSKVFEYWELALRCTGLFGDAVDKKIESELQGDEIILQSPESSSTNKKSLLEIKYRLFDRIWEMSENYINLPSIGMITLKIKYASAHELLKGLPIIFEKTTSNNYNNSKIKLDINEFTLYKYVHECCIELANRGHFLDANKLIENFITSPQRVQELKELLSKLQEVYARERVKKEEIKRRIVDDDNDFDLW